MFSEDFPNVAIKTRGIVARCCSRMEIENVRGQRQIEPRRSRLQLPVYVWGYLKLNGFACSHALIIGAI